MKTWRMKEHVYDRRYKANLSQKHTIRLTVQKPKRGVKPIPSKRSTALVMLPCILPLQQTAYSVKYNTCIL